MATTISMLEPVIAALLAVVRVGERLPPSGWAGVGLIVTCLGLITVPAGKLRFSLFRQRKENFEIAKRKEL
jgi:DME family drug/metabolite transporter